MTVLLHDATWIGFLTAMFRAFELKDVLISSIKNETPGLFESSLVEPDDEKALRVEKGLELLGDEVSLKVYYIFLSEIPGIENDLLEALRIGFKHKIDPFVRRENDAVRRCALAAGSVPFAAHRLMGLIRFSCLENGLYISDFSHEYNLLPLIGEHFHKRFRDQRFIIRDPKRKTAIISSASGWEIRDLPDGELPTLPDAADYERLWKGYIETIAIKERVNLKLQQHFVPKKYREYITEFK